MSLANLIPSLQLSIGPVILISGIGLILLSMTNRFGRVIDRARHLTRDLHGALRCQPSKYSGTTPDSLNPGQARSSLYCLCRSEYPAGSHPYY